MTALYWQTIGEGERDLVLLHGWGLNAEVWSCIQARLAPHFRLHLVDLPGVRPQPGVRRPVAGADDGNRAGGRPVAGLVAGLVARRAGGQPGGVDAT